MTSTASPVIRRFSVTGYSILVVALGCVSAFLITTFRSGMDILGVNVEYFWLIWGGV